MASNPRAAHDPLEVLRERCRDAGMSLTPQRVAIYRALHSSKDHPSPEELFARVRRTQPTLSLATIYKTLEVLAALGLASELPSTGDRRRYDANMDRHHHLVCTRCGAVADWHDERLDRVALPRSLDGFRPETVTVEVRGLCRRCSAARPPSTRRGPRPARSST